MWVIMEKVLSLKINQNEHISIYVPSFKKKWNSYRKPIEKLDRFDEVTVLYEIKNERITLEKNIIDEILYGLTIVLKKTINNERIIPNSIEIGEMGKIYNIETKKKNWAIDCGYNYGIFCGKNNTTFIYNNKAGEIFLEISPLYPWAYLKPKYRNQFISFVRFMKRYKTYALIQINKEIAKQWLEEVEGLYKKLNDEFNEFWYASRKN